MGLFDSLSGGLKSVLGDVEAAALPVIMSDVLSKTSLGSLQGIVEKLQAGGLNEQVKSWLGNGANLSVTPEQIQAALGNSHLQEIAQHLGIPADEVAKFLAEHLPAAVDHASPEGQVETPPGAALEDKAGDV